MKTSSVSFGHIVAISGSKSKINNLNRYIKEKQQEEVLIYDITDMYKDLPYMGVLSQNARQGNSIALYVSGDDVEKVKNKESNYNTLEGIVSAMKYYYDAGKCTLQYLTDSIIRKF